MLRWGSDLSRILHVMLLSLFVSAGSGIVLHTVLGELARSLTGHSAWVDDGFSFEGRPDGAYKASVITGWLWHCL